MTDPQTPDPAIPGLLARPPREAVRMLASVHLDAAEQAFQRLSRDRDSEALHDFRVALRRLRSLLQAYSPLFEDSVRPQLMALLRRVARATGRSRDMEVRAQSLAELAVELPEWAAAPTDSLLDGVRAARVRADERMLTKVERRFPKLLRRLRSAFGSYTAPVPHPGLATPSFANVAGLQLELHSTALLARLAVLDGTEDIRDVHAARLEAKRLRYLVEPLMDHVPHADESVRRLKQLQDVTGDLHDAEILLDWLEMRQADRGGSGSRSAQVVAAGDDSATGESSAKTGGSTTKSHTGGRDGSARAEDQEAGARDGAPEEGETAEPRRVLTLMHDLTSARKHRLWAELHASTAEFSAAADIAPVVEALLAEELTVERERKYLLSELPPEALAARSVYIEQGYLPGDQLVERLRRVVDGDTARMWRTVKVGTGLSRIELEEPCDAPLFAALWPFTEGRRVLKRRFEVAAANESGVWEVDSFMDRDLVLAEFEFHGAGTEVDLPEWLSRYLVREVTGEREYVNAVLAR